jgi:hypothetical protein
MFNKGKRPIAAITAAILLSGCGGASAVTLASEPAQGASAVVATAPTPPPSSAAPAAAPSPTPTKTGAQAQLSINVAPSVYFGGERTFANLAYATGQSDAARIFLNVPQPVWSNVPTLITCTWAGTGTLFVDGDRQAETYGDHTFSVTWKGYNAANGSRPSMFINLSRTSPSDPIRNLDCREPGEVAVGQFDKRLVDDLKFYGVLRFLDWSAANGNPASVTWDRRTLPSDNAQSGVDGMAIENMVDLANATDSDAWFTVPWNSDETYVHNMAQLVHDRLSSGHRAYFELSNEIWNFQFSVATQVLNEGVAEKLSTDRYTNGLLRYAEKSTWMHKILTDVFRDNSARLVRVVGAQNDNPWVGEQIMGFRDTAQWVDALATAPYFGHSFFDGANANVTDLPILFASLETARVTAISKAVTNKATALRYGKRYIAYEAGQHIIATQQANADTAARMQRSPLMYEIYKRYIADWKSQMGDTIAFYSATGSISQYGSWGIREYAGQSLNETPKRRAVLEYAQ